MGCGKKDKDGIDKSKDNCICEIVRAIKDIQDTVIEDDCECPKSCLLEPLGTLGAVEERPNTRVIVLKTADGSPFHAFYKHSGGLCTSIFFRVEEVFDNCCATLRVLKPRLGSTSGCASSGSITDNCCIDLDQLCALNITDFDKTNDCVTVDLSCFCAVQCIKDTLLDDICD